MATKKTRKATTAKKTPNSRSELTTPAPTDVRPVGPRSPLEGVDSGVVLDMAPRMFDVARRASGIGAVLFEYVRINELFVQAGYETMQDYAKAKLGISSGPYFKKAGQAGVAAWEYLPDVCEAVMASLPSAGYPGIQLDNPPPAVPNMSVLARLPAALRKLPEEQHVQFLADVVEGTYTRAEVEAIGNRHAAPRVLPARGEAINRENGNLEDETGDEDEDGEPDSGHLHADTSNSEGESAETPKDSTAVGGLRPFFPNTSEQVFAWAEQHAAAGQQEAVLSIAIIASYEKMKLVSWLVEHDTRFTAIVERVRRVLDSFGSLGTGKLATQILRRIEAVEAELVDAASKR